MFKTIIIISLLVALVYFFGSCHIKTITSYIIDIGISVIQFIAALGVIILQNIQLLFN
jgi:hypothetical protein